MSDGSWRGNGYSVYNSVSCLCPWLLTSSSNTWPPRACAPTGALQSRVLPPCTHTPCPYAGRECPGGLHSKLHALPLGTVAGGPFSRGAPWQAGWTPPGRRSEGTSWPCPPTCESRTRIFLGCPRGMTARPEVLPLATPWVAVTSTPSSLTNLRAPVLPLGDTSQPLYLVNRLYFLNKL